MNCCIVAVAALNSLSIYLIHASTHVEIQQLALTESGSSLQSEGSSPLRASDVNLVMLDKLEHRYETQPSFIDKEVSSIHIYELDRIIYQLNAAVRSEVRTYHGSAAHTDPRVGLQPVLQCTVAS